MEVNRLLGDEILYELNIRGLPINRLVTENRATLRGAFGLERQGYSSVKYLDQLDIGEELEIGRQKLLDLGHDIANFNRSNFENEYRRLRTRLIHLSLRVKRIPVGLEDQEEDRQALLGSSLRLLDEVNDIYEEIQATRRQVNNQVSESRSILDQANEIHQSILDDPNPLVPEEIAQSSAAINRFQPRSQLVEDGNVERCFPQECRFLVGELDSINQRRQSHMEADSSLIQSTRFEDWRVSGLQPMEPQPVGLERFPVQGSRRQSAEDGPVRNDAEQTQHLSRSEPRRPLIPRKETEAHRILSFHADTFRPSSSRRATLGDDDELCAALNSHRRQTNSGIDLTRDLGDRLHNFGLSENPVYDHSFDGHTKYVDISRWKLQFDGESSVTSFLERVEELRISRNVSHEQLLRSAVELFTKEALLWYRTQKFDSWEDLVSKLKGDFQPYDYVLDLWEEIRKRTQGAKERVISYVAAVENLFNRLGESKPGEKTRVDWIRRGLLPHIQSQLAIQNIETVGDLTRLSRLVEETFSRTQKFCAPPTNIRSLLEPDLAYRKPTSSQIPASSSPCFTIAGDNPVSKGKEVERQLANTDNSPCNNSPLCWNCGKRGHRFKKCSEPRKVFCYRCGLEKVVARNCPNCSKNQQGGSK